ncbi:hypothetical protein KCP71_14725 [Salmonella enterica subsp. enterica]|nr:hypothetical protein KCP71_14725 [Salmonella enterica subsp. enterica]
MKKAPSYQHYLDSEILLGFIFASSSTTSVTIRWKPTIAIIFAAVPRLTVKIRGAYACVA